MSLNQHVRQRPDAIAALAQHLQFSGRTVTAKWLAIADAVAKAGSGNG